MAAADRVVSDGMTYLPPAARGDVERAAREHDAVLLIDGVFHHDLAPSPKECFEATRHAATFGASSMGALRAAECAPYGFLPLGAIARWYTHGAIDGDDEVAVLTHPQTHAALSVALVNVRYLAWVAYRRGALTAGERDGLVAAARDVFYMERTWEDVIERAPERARESLRAAVAEGADLKRLDARFALRTVLRMRERGTPRPRNAVTIPAAMPKTPGTYDRSVPFEQTLALVPELRRRYGITRVAETTHLDIVGIPTVAAMVPSSPDFIGVYNGKGITREAAIASAVMEAVERQIGAAVRLPVFRESLEVVGKRIDLEACGMRDDIGDEMVDCVAGTELLSGDVVPVPLAMVQCPYFGAKLFDVTTTNGLASGNNLAEAIYHALCELVERHAWAIYHARCSIAPRYYLGERARDVSLAPRIALPAGDATVDALVSAIDRAGLIVRAFLLEEPPLPYTAIATIAEPNSSPPMAHLGLGCALSPAHALTRALTEAVQCRLTDIQGAREDILRPYEPVGITGSHGRRITSLPTDQWYYSESQKSVDLSRIPDRSSDDIARDVRATLESLRAYGVSSVIVVDLSPADLPLSVVRAVVPELETFMFTGHVGARMRAEFNPFTVRSA